MTTSAFRPRPMALIILDGWGYRENPEANAIAHATKPCWDYLWSHCPHTLASGCGRCVGLPDGQMGNSEVGHMNMGAGRVIHQDLTRIDAAIESGEFAQNPVLREALQKAKTSALHIMGLLSPGGVHSQEAHIIALLECAAQQKVENVYIHAFLDGRDTPPQSAASSLKALTEKTHQLKCGKISTLVGRYFAMDRDKRWERTEKAYALLTEGKALFCAENAVSGLEQAYQRGETDEFVEPTICGNYPGMKDGDVVIFMNFRADRARQLTQAFVDPQFQGFTREKTLKLADFVSLTEYEKNLKTTVAFPPQTLDHILPQYLSEQHLKQLRIAETEKYAHVTYFFNGGVEQPFPGEERILIPSPKVATYDLKPEMSAVELTDRLIEEIRSQKYDVIICNYANPDMVGHSGDFDATVKAIETVDACLSRVLAELKIVGGEAIITADHGNAEMMFDHETNQPHTAHTHEKVPVVYVGRPAKALKVGVLADIAPTLLYLMGFKQPPEMTGEKLFELI